MNKKDFSKFKNKILKTSDSDLFGMITGMAKKASQKVVYTALLLFYAYRNKQTPKWAKRVVLGAIAYFLFPFDFIPDLAPFLGYTDDLEMLSLSLVVISCYVNDENKEKAKSLMNKWFGQTDTTSIQEIDDRLS